MQSQPLVQDKQMQAISEEDLETARKRRFLEIADESAKLLNYGISYEAFTFLSRCQKILDDGHNNVVTDFIKHVLRGGEQYLLQANIAQARMQQRLLQSHEAASFGIVKMKQFIWRLPPREQIPMGRGRGVRPSFPVEPRPGFGRGRGCVRNAVAGDVEFPPRARPQARRAIGSGLSPYEPQEIAEQSYLVPREDFERLRDENTALQSETRALTSENATLKDDYSKLRRDYRDLIAEAVCQNLAWAVAAPRSMEGEYLQNHETLVQDFGARHADPNSPH